jgi:hypothetical protein
MEHLTEQGAINKIVKLLIKLQSNLTKFESTYQNYGASYEVTSTLQS